MDGLSVTASGIAVVSLDAQVVDGIIKLHDFWSSIKEAPEDIKDNLVELKVLSSVLTQIAHDKQQHEPDPTFADVLSVCRANVSRLAALLGEIEPGFASTSSRIRKWTAIKAVRMQGKLVKFQEGLEGLKTTLLLAQGRHTR
ncbi:MAG: hypothetical protein Q9170_002880 [Blastenia crenularia]